MSRPMTNYNERLDEILHTAKVNWKTSPDEIFDKGVTAYAKQAITSLIKELVAEARIDELKDVRPGKDSDVMHLQSVIDERLATLQATNPEKG